MPFTPILRGIEVAFHGHNATGQEIINVYHFRTQGPGVTPLDVLTVAQYMATTGWNVIRQALSSAYTADFVIGRDISVLGGYETTVYVPAPNTGAIGGAVLPGNCAIDISWRAAATGRRNRGRTYYGVLPETSAFQDTIQSSLITALINIANMLITSGSATGSDFSVRSLVDAAMKVITGFVINTTLDSQRRRLLERGK
jgi:hypothetical protein